MTTTAIRRVHRIEVYPTPIAGDPVADALVRDAAALGYPLASVRTAKVYLIETDAADTDLYKTHQALLADPVTEEAYTGAEPAAPDAVLIEVHPLPGVMDPVAGSVAEVLREVFGIEADVVTGRRYELRGVTHEHAMVIARRLLASPVISSIHTEPFHPDALPHGQTHDFVLTQVPIRDLDDGALERLSREAHLFLSLDEMRAIRDEYHTLDREPTDIELETLAQTWSEHCVHKTLKSRVVYRGPGSGDGIDWTGRPGHVVNADGSVTIDNLLKRTVAAATHELIAEGRADWCLSVFIDNAGIVAFDDEHAVCVKVETHNHPSAIEPYGGAATGIGGCIRDIIGTGLAAKPIASTDVFCVAFPDHFTTEGTESTGGSDGAGYRGGGVHRLPAGCLPPRRVLTEVVAGVRDYGNRMGIPTVNGAVYFDDRYVGNPLVYCGCVGVMPRGEKDAFISGDAKPGDRIIALGGRTGRDGIHGATFSSAELTDTHAEEFSHAVQIGNAIEEKRVLDAILRARDGVVESGAIGNGQSAMGEGRSGPLFSAITDCGAGGFSSAVGEMGEKIGAEVHLERAPLKYDGLRYTEIWISEAQERMVLAVPAENVAALKTICDEEHVEMADLGHFGTDGAELVLRYHGAEVGRMPMAFLHDGIPMPEREAAWMQPRVEVVTSTDAPDVRTALLALLAHPNIASKHFIVRQYDHEVQGNTVIKPLGGPLQRGPMDAAVIEPVPGTGRGLAIACGLATGMGDPARGGDPYQMALAAIDECVRNLVCVGADPGRIAILDNFCWPSCKKPVNMASLVRACEGCYDGAKAYGTPFVSGKDSLNNQFTTEGGRTIEIPPTLLISGIGVVEDVARCVTMDAKRAGSTLVLVGAHDERLGGSHYDALFGGGGAMPAVDLHAGPRTAAAVARLVAGGIARSVHDVSDGGVLVAIAEMLIAGSDADTAIGFAADASMTSSAGALFGEGPSRYVVETDDVEALRGAVGGDAAVTVLGSLDDSGSLVLAGTRIGVGDLAKAWLGGLDW